MTPSKDDSSSSSAAAANASLDISSPSQIQSAFEELTNEEEIVNQELEELLAKQVQLEHRSDLNKRPLKAVLKANFYLKASGTRLVDAPDAEAGRGGRGAAGRGGGEDGHAGGGRRREGQTARPGQESRQRVPEQGQGSHRPQPLQRRSQGQSFCGLRSAFI